MSPTAPAEDKDLLEKIFLEFNSLSVVYMMPAEVRH